METRLLGIKSCIKTLTIVQCVDVDRLLILFLCEEPAKEVAIFDRFHISINNVLIIFLSLALIKQHL